MEHQIRFPHLGIVLKNVGDGINIGGFEIKYYGMIIATGFLLGLIVSYYAAKHENKFDETKLKINTNDEEEEIPKKVVKNISEITNINAEKKIEPEVKEEKEVIVNKNYILPSFDLLDSPQKNKKAIDHKAKH